MSTAGETSTTSVGATDRGRMPYNGIMRLELAGGRKNRQRERGKGYCHFATVSAFVIISWEHNKYMGLTKLLGKCVARRPASVTSTFTLTGRISSVDLRLRGSDGMSWQWHNTIELARVTCALTLSHVAAVSLS